MKPRIRAIFFDIDDTLFSTSGFAALARRNAVAAMIRYGLRMRPADALRELREVIAEFSSNYEHHFEKLLVRIPAERRRGVNPAILVAAAVTAYHDTKFRSLRPYPDVLPALRALAATRLVRGVVTAGLEIKQAEKLVRLRVYPLLTPEAIFISDQVGISKPNVKLYLRACGDCRVDPRETAYVGDHPAHDIDPPNSIGMTTFRVLRNDRHARERGRTEPTHTVRDFRQIVRILRDRYGVRPR